MIDKQLDTELKYSIRHIQTLLLDYIDPENTIFQLAVDRVNQYRAKEYSYASKNKRIAQLKRPTDEIVLETLCLTTLCQEHTTIQSICTKLGNALKITDKLDSIKTAAEIIGVLHGPFYSIIPAIKSTTETIAILSHFKLPEAVLKQLEQVHYIPPMKCKPKNWSNNFDGGYLTIKNNAVLGTGNIHTMPLALDFLNIIQSIAFELDNNIIELEESLSKKLTKVKSIRQFKQLKNESEKIYKEYKNIPFYFVGAFDTRGRFNYRGYHINIQSYEFKRASINFHKKWRVTC